MLFKDRIKNLTAVYPRLSRVWINTGDPKMPLKGVWIAESCLHHIRKTRPRPNRKRPLARNPHHV